MLILYTEHQNEARELKNIEFLQYIKETTYPGAAHLQIPTQHLHNQHIYKYLTNICIMEHKSRLYFTLV